MVYDSTNIVVAGSGQIRVAPVGTVCPTTFVTPAWDPAWVELGWTDEKGVTGNDQRTLNDVKVWQSIYAAYKIVTERKFEFTFNLEEWTKDSFALAYGGGAWTTTAGVSVYTPPAASFLDMRSLAVDFQSQGFNWRWHVSKGLVDSNVQTVLSRTGESLLPISFGVLGATGTAPWEVYTDNPKFSAAAWAATTAFTLNQVITLGAGAVRASVAGTSGATIPTLPAAVGGTVVDGSVTWTRTV